MERYYPRDSDHLKNTKNKKTNTHKNSLSSSGTWIRATLPHLQPPSLQVKLTLPVTHPSLQAVINSTPLLSKKLFSPPYTPPLTLLQL